MMVWVAALERGCMANWGAVSDWWLLLYICLTSGHMIMLICENAINKVM